MKSYNDIHSVFILLECALGNNFNNKPVDKHDAENLDFELNIEQKFLVCSVSVHVERQLTSKKIGSLTWKLKFSDFKERQTIAQR